MPLALPLLLALGCPVGPAADGKQPEDKGGDTAGADSGDTADTGADTAADTGGDTADTAVDPATRDQDGDGFTPLDGDCDDALPHVYPGAPDYCDGLDQDCDGEPIPDGSCSLRGDGRSMWSWLVEAQDGTEGWLHGPVGDQDGDGLAELGFETSVSGQSHDGVRVGSLFGSDWALRPAIGAYPTRSYSMAGSRYILPDQQFAGDVDGDGMNEMFVESRDDDYYEGAVVLFYGRSGGWPDGGGVLEEEADAYWAGSGDVQGLATLPAGDFNGDGLSDLLTRTYLSNMAQGAFAVVFGTEERWYGGAALESLPMLLTESTEGTLDANRLEVVPDLDGDGTDELSFPYRRASDTVYFQAFVSGAELSDGAQLADSMSLMSYTDGNIPNPLTYHTHDAGDWNRDGYNDLAAAPYPEHGELVCASLLSGGIPEGSVEDQAFAKICELEWVSVMSGWVPDMDDDGEPELMADWNCIVASHRMVIGGTVLLDNVGGPCLSVDSDGRGLAYAVANVTGDERVEMAIQLAYPDVETAMGVSAAIIAGFDIPYDDPSKW